MGSKPGVENYETAAASLTDEWPSKGFQQPFIALSKRRSPYLRTV